MKNSFTFIVFTFLLQSLFSCSNEIIVRFDFDKSVEIHRLPTYRWLQEKHIEALSNPLYYNELNDKRIKIAVADHLRTKGYSKTDSAASDH